MRQIYEIFLLQGFSFAGVSVSIVASRFSTVFLVRETLTSALVFEEDIFYVDDGTGKGKTHVPRRKAIGELPEGAMWIFGREEK